MPLCTPVLGKIQKLPLPTPQHPQQSELGLWTVSPWSHSSPSPASLSAAPHSRNWFLEWTLFMPLWLVAETWLTPVAGTTGWGCPDPGSVSSSWHQIPYAHSPTKTTQVASTNSLQHTHTEQRLRRGFIKKRFNQKVGQTAVIRHGAWGSVRQAYGPALFCK